jgi:ABC-type transport system involved in cytochrome c biogenesis permease subunit
MKSSSLFRAGCLASLIMAVIIGLTTDQDQIKNVGVFIQLVLVAILCYLGYLEMRIEEISAKRVSQHDKS